MNKAEILNQIKELEERLFILELDDFAFMHGKGGEIRALYKTIAELKKQIGE